MEVIGIKFVGTKVLLTGTFTREGSAVAVDPDIVRARVRKPGGVLSLFVFGVDASVTRRSQGIYELRYVVDLPGRYWFGFEGTAGLTVTAVEEVSLLVRRRQTVAA
jgi:hypothetical protein